MTGPNLPNLGSERVTLCCNAPIRHEVDWSDYTGWNECTACGMRHPETRLRPALSTTRNQETT